MRGLRKGTKVVLCGYAKVLQQGLEPRSVWKVGETPYFNGHTGKVTHIDDDDIEVRLDKKDLAHKYGIRVPSSRMAGSLVQLHVKQLRKVKAK